MLLGVTLGPLTLNAEALLVVDGPEQLVPALEEEATVVGFPDDRLAEGPADEGQEMGTAGWGGPWRDDSSAGRHC